MSRFIHVNEEVEVEQQGHLSIETEEKRFGFKANKDSNINTKDKSHSVVDIKGAVTLAAAVTSFLLVLTYVEPAISAIAAKVIAASCLEWILRKS